MSGFLWVFETCKQLSSGLRGTVEEQGRVWTLAAGCLVPPRSTISWTYSFRHLTWALYAQALLTVNWMLDYLSQREKMVHSAPPLDIFTSLLLYPFPQM